ncbi:MAG: uroporphyrinogen decarboxylase [Chloroflexi bacterium]|nr:uroporphyrinogen decarboxylase [Chloroflexota bacterium]
MAFNDRFLRACRREPVDRTPIWIMRQAGRYLAEYREIRRGHSFLEMCKTPELACQVTVQPIDRLGVDAAILFADILLPLEPMGLQIEFGKDEGPAIRNPVRSMADVSRLRVVDAGDCRYVPDAIKLVRKELEGRVPLIGFAGAPFTLASYVVEGGGTRTYRLCKTLMLDDPRAWHALLDKLAETIIVYLNAQIEAGAQAVQVFDSWVGNLSPQDYRENVLPHSAKVFANLDKRVPHIHFANQAGTMLELVKQAGGDVVGLDWRVEIDSAMERLGDGVAVQGNLDPMALFARPEVIREKVRDILERVGKRPGHVFNLGHGVHKDTPVEHVQALVELVHEISAEIRGRA